MAMEEKILWKGGFKRRAENTMKNVDINANISSTSFVKG